MPPVLRPGRLSSPAATPAGAATGNNGQWFQVLLATSSVNPMVAGIGAKQIEFNCRRDRWTDEQCVCRGERDVGGSVA